MTSCKGWVRGVVVVIVLGGLALVLTPNDARYYSTSNVMYDCMPADETRTSWTRALSEPERRRREVCHLYQLLSITKVAKAAKVVKSSSSSTRPSPTS